MSTHSYFCTSTASAYQLFKELKKKKVQISPCLRDLKRKVFNLKE